MTPEGPAPAGGLAAERRDGGTAGRRVAGERRAAPDGAGARQGYYWTVRVPCMLGWIEQWNG